MDSETFFAPNIPSEVYACVPLLYGMDIGVLTACLNKIVEILMANKEMSRSPFIKF